MLEEARTLDSREQESAALNALTMTLFFSHRLEETVTRAVEALKVAEQAGSEKLRIETLALVALKNLCYGELNEGEPILDDIIRIARDLDHKPVLTSALAWRGCLYFFQTEYEQAVQCEVEARQLASELRDGFLLLTSLFFLGLSQGNLGRISAALAALNEGIEIAGRNGDLFWYPRMPNCIGWIHRELQDLEGALKYDQQGLAVGREHHVLEAEANSLINIGADHTKRHDEPEKSMSAFREVEDIFKRDAWFRWRYNIRLQAGKSEYWLVQGDIEKAEDFARGLLETATHYKVRKYVATAHQLLAQIAIARGDLNEADSQLNTALAQLREYSAPLVAWKTYAVLGRLRSQSGDSASAREAFAQAAAIVNSIAGNTDDEALRQTFLNSAAVREVLNGAGEAVPLQSAAD